jgi:hypothetical protein
VRVWWHWGPTARMKMSFPALGRSWETSLYGISTGNVFFGVMVRGKRCDRDPS